MANSVYTINKGINKRIEFKGLKAQYIGYLGISFLILLILFAVLYILGIHPFTCMAFVFTCGTVAGMKIYRLSHKYGEHGLMKKMARRLVPTAIKASSRRVFMKNTR
jgi:hypothetical protein